MDAMQRAEFEKWAAPKSFRLTRSIPDGPARWYYLDSVTHAAWQGWQARPTGGAEAMRDRVVALLATYGVGDASDAMTRIETVAALALPDDAPKWSSQVPTVAGWYWCSQSPNTCEVVLVEADLIHLQRVGRFAAESVGAYLKWSGPIPEPVGE